MSSEESPKEPVNDKIRNTYAILGGNLLVFALYTVILIAIDKRYYVGAFDIAMLHMIFCFGVYLGSKEYKSTWLLAAILILLIGCGTCVNYFKL